MRRVRYASVFLVSVLVLPAAASAQQVGTVTGTVVDSGNGQPIAGALRCESS